MIGVVQQQYITNLVLLAANTVKPVISGIGYAGQTLTATAGSWTKGTVSGQWYANGVAIAGATGLSYVVATIYHGAEFTYVETNATITASSNAIHHMVITDIENLEFWMDREQSEITLDASGKVSVASDLSTKARHATQTDVAFMPAPEGVLNGHDAFTFENSYLSVSGLPTTGVMSYFSVSKHRADSNYGSLVGSSAGDTYLPMSYFEDVTWDEVMRVNGLYNPVGAKYLVAGESVPSATNQFQVFGSLIAGTVITMVNTPAITGDRTLIGQYSETDSTYGLRGQLKNIAMVSGELTNVQSDRITAIVAWSSNVPLPPEHTYHLAPPSVQSQQ